MKAQPDTVTCARRHDRSATIVTTVRSRARVRAARLLDAGIIHRPTTSEPAPIDPPASTEATRTPDERRFDADTGMVDGARFGARASYDADTRRLAHDTNVEGGARRAPEVARAFDGSDDDEAVTP